MCCSWDKYELLLIGSLTTSLPYAMTIFMFAFFSGWMKFGLGVIVNIRLFNVQVLQNFSGNNFRCYFYCYLSGWSYRSKLKFPRAPIVYFRRSDRLYVFILALTFQLGVRMQSNREWSVGICGGLLTSLEILTLLQRFPAANFCGRKVSQFWSKLIGAIGTSGIFFPCTIFNVA